MKKMFLKSSKAVVESIADFYEHFNYLQDFEDHKWQKGKCPEPYCHIYKITSNLLMCLHYDCSMTNYGTTPVAKLEEITVCFRDGKTEYELIKGKLDDLKKERLKVKRSKALDIQIERLEHVNNGVDIIFPKFTKPFEFNKGEQLCLDSIVINKKKISRSSIASQYAVIDLETNGLRSSYDDLLSITLYDPSSGKIYNRFLPLELQPTVLTTHINGIDDSDLENAMPLCQKEFDDLIREFDLTNKTILFYSGRDFDYIFLKKYLNRHKILGIDSLKFENIKKRIASSSYESGMLTKDNLCKALGIKGVSKVHSGVNDCYIEWKLFDRFVCHKLLIKNNYIYMFNEKYIIPASYLTSFPKLFEIANIEVPNISYQSTLIYEYYLPSNITKKIRKYPTNISGISIENMINYLVGAKRCNNIDFLHQNNQQLQRVGKLPSVYEKISVATNSNGFLISIDSKYDEYIARVNETSKMIKNGISDVVKFIRENIFKNEEIRTQEITFSENHRVLALCDLSSDDAVLEIKTFDIFNCKETENVIRQMYYQKGNKVLYAMSIIFDFSYTKKGEQRLENLIFKIYKVDIEKTKETI